MIALDTNVVSETLRPVPNQRVMAWLIQHVGEVTFTSISVAELSAGMEVLPDGRRKAELARTLEDIFDSYHHVILTFDAPAGRRYGEIVATRRAEGHPIGTEDAMIAAICLAEHLPLATRNTRDFSNLGLTLINPWD